MATRFLQIILFLLPFGALKAQFITNGTAQLTSDRCWTLTPAQNTKVGSVWNETKINLNESFDVALDVYLGCIDAQGADGLVFGFQPVSTSIGVSGEGLGFGGVQPSIGIEIDTWQNNNKSDPAFDHVAIISNGDVSHSSSNNLAGPVGIGGNLNIEDCQFHDLRVVWDATKKKLELSWDCKPLLSYTGDIVNTIFKGDPWVYWGFTAATGGAVNEHKICLKYNSFVSDLPDTTICVGGQVQLKATNGVSYQWSPAAGLSNPSVSNPIAKPDKTTEYKVVITDKCGQQYADSLLVKVGGNPVTFELGKDTMLCQGQVLVLNPNIQDAKYQWQDGSNETSYNATKSGVYKVNIEKNFCYASDSIRLKFLETPSVFLGVDTVLCLKNKIILNAKVENGTYKWQDDSYLDSYVVNTSGVYAVTVKNNCGMSSDEIKIDYEDCYKVFIPNTFSPDGDGNNEVFRIYSSENIVKVEKFEIFNRWGNLVFSAQNYTPDDTNGVWDGKNALVGVYIYYAEITFKDGKTEVISGDITLIR